MASHTLSKHVCDLCQSEFLDQYKFFEHLKFHYEGVNRSTMQPPISAIAPPPKIARPKRKKVKGINPISKTGRHIAQSQFGIKGTKAEVKTENYESVQIENKMSGSNAGFEEKPASSFWENIPPTSWAPAPAITNLKNPSTTRELPCGIGDHVEPLNSNLFQLTPSSPIASALFPSPESNFDDQETEEMGETKTKVKLPISEEEGKTLLKCDLCPKVFSHRNSLIYHMRSHTGERPHQCPHCPKRFFATSALKVHLRLHSGEKPYDCDECPLKFRQWGDLKHHKISVHSEERAYQCEFCGKNFARKYSLVIHRRIHTDERNYKCEFCQKRFRAASYLQNHRRIHTGEKRHSCSICGKRFRVRSDMKRHETAHSKNIKVANVVAAVAGLPEDFSSAGEIYPLLSNETGLGILSLDEAHHPIPVIAAFSTLQSIQK